MGEFGRFIIQNVNNPSLMESTFDFINQTLSSGGPSTEDVIVLQVFEQLYEDPHLVHVSKGFLQGKAKDIFEKNFKK